MCGFAVCFFCLSPLSGSSVRTWKEQCCKLKSCKLMFISSSGKSSGCFLYSLGGSVSMLLRPSWALLPSVTLAGLFFTLFSPELHAKGKTDERRTSRVSHTQQQSYNSMSIKAISCKCTRRPDGLRSLLCRGLQRALGKVFKSRFVFFTAEREIVSLSLKGEKQGEVSTAGLRWMKGGLPQSKGDDRARFSLTHGNGDTLMIIHEVVFVRVTNTKTRSSGITP